MLPQLPRGASPGLDGLPYEFYTRFWADLGPAFLWRSQGTRHCCSTGEACAGEALHLSYNSRGL